MTDQERAATCKECGCTTGGGDYCYAHAPYLVTPKKDGSFLVDRNGRKRVTLEEQPAPQPEWQPIETAPKDRKVAFWVVPKLSEESYTDTQGRPIVWNAAPYQHFGKYGTWSSSGKAVLWHELPVDPPAKPED